MTGNAKVLHGVPAQSLTVLKPQKLGRHHHKIPQYIKESTNKNPRLIGDYFLRNYRINLELNRIDVRKSAAKSRTASIARPWAKLGFPSTVRC